MSHANVLVTGGAGFIGSHLCELLVAQGRRVRVLDNLEPPTHLGKPWLPAGVEFQRGDIRNVADVERALRSMDAVVHLGGTGGFTADVERYVEVNALGSARLYEAAARARVAKLVVASSVGIYGEGAYRCPEHGAVHPGMRRASDLEQGRWEHACARCGAPLAPVPTPEEKTPEPGHAYSVSVYARERLALASGIPAAALRLFLTYGPRQSLTNPYTGTVSLFSTRLLNDLPPIVYEDGLQTRDFVYVEDVARALALALDRAEGVFNVGTGAPTAIGELARALARCYRRSIEPELPGYYRPGEARHVVADAARLRALGWEPRVPLAEGLGRYAEWIAGQGPVADSLGAALGALQRSGVVRSAAGRAATSPAEEGLSVIVPAYNEAGNLESILRALLAELPAVTREFEVVVVNDGSRDGTGPIADRLAAEDERIRVVHHPFNIGFGGAQKSGFRAARLDWVVVVPADHQFDVRDLARFWERRRDCDLVASVRADRHDSLGRKAISAGFNAFMRSVLGIPLRDVNWVKMWRRTLFDSIQVELRGFGVDAEIVAKARALGYRMAEIEVPHYPRTWGTSSTLRAGVIWRTARELLAIPAMLRRIRDGAGRDRARAAAAVGAGDGAAADPGR
jgi:dTDP-L-rhamnose 4-epimerase